MKSQFDAIFVERQKRFACPFKYPKPTMKPSIFCISLATILFIVGCSKSPSTATQADKHKQALDALRKQYEDGERKIADAEQNLDVLRKKYNVHDNSPQQLVETNLALTSSEEPYWLAKRSLAKMIDFQKALQAKITQEEIDTAIPPH